MLTIFTPVYNRAYIIEKLFESLCKQTSYNFEWLIVDDGSTDDLKDLVQNWLSINNLPFSIQYYYQENGGKHRAINQAVKLANGDAFFIVDSDDYLVEDAVEQVLNWWEDISDNDIFAGVSGLRIFDDGNIVGEIPQFENYMDVTNLERSNYGLLGDKAEVYKTKILQKYPFPEFEGENFITEAVVWDKIAYDKYKIRWYNKGIYVCGYRDDGLTYQGRNLYIKNPNGYGLYLQQCRRYCKWSEFETLFHFYLFCYDYKSMMPNEFFSYEKYCGISETEVELEHNRLVKKFIEKIGKQIAVYGIGRRGNDLLKFFQNSIVEIAYVMDKRKLETSYRYIDIDIVNHLPDVDAIIVTPKCEQESIVDKLKNKTQNIILRYDEWFNLMKEI